MNAARGLGVTRRNHTCKPPPRGFVDGSADLETSKPKIDPFWGVKSRPASHFRADFLPHLGALGGVSNQMRAFMVRTIVALVPQCVSWVRSSHTFKRNYSLSTRQVGRHGEDEGCRQWP